MTKDKVDELKKQIEEISNHISEKEEELVKLNSKLLALLKVVSPKGKK